MAQDLTNGEIAERLVVSPGTVKWYVKEIYSKLGVHSRDEAVAALGAQTAPADAPAEGLEAAPAVPNNLPTMVTPLVGRQNELRAVNQLIQSNAVRLLTLIGPPGIGKTRLCFEAGTALLPRFLDGVHFVALAPLNDPDLVASTILQALDHKERGSEPAATTLANHLRGRTVLLILDNFEHLLPPRRWCRTCWPLPQG
ncbi:MAG: AAA family ATPase [Chloroflexi bacterium]|nr:AAA family ATPase [Chloroflexota bacterium]